ncbi:hypothetical protein OROMI_026899 [Orobanche minor]
MCSSWHLFQSLYIPGSVDVNDKHIDQHNVIPPPLYLWSHPDWSLEHYTIAQECGHISNPTVMVENSSTRFGGRISTVPGNAAAY